MTPRDRRICRKCWNAKITPVYHPETVTVQYDGEEWSLFIPKMPVFQCPACGHQPKGWGRYEIGQVVNHALAKKAGVLMPDEIAAMHDPDVYNYRKIARAITSFSGKSVYWASISCWEDGMCVQGRAMDAILRRYRRHLQNCKERTAE